MNLGKQINIFLFLKKNRIISKTYAIILGGIAKSYNNTIKIYKIYLPLFILLVIIRFTLIVDKIK